MNNRFAYIKGGKLFQDSGSVSGVDFVGSPRKALVSLGVDFPASEYSVVISGGADERIWTVEDLSVSGFTINSNADSAVSGIVYWIAQKHGVV